MSRSSLELAVALLFAVLFAFLWWRLHRRRNQALRRNQRRGEHARTGEERAETLLRDIGFVVLARQAEHDWPVWCDDERCAILLRADYLVERDGRRFVAEVKTGELAPSLAHAATRRQLLEYQLAWDVDSVLLVDVDGGTVSEVRFLAQRLDDG